MIFNNLVDAVGHTPLVKLQFPTKAGADAYAKLEMQNLFGMKDRVARQAILHAKQNGELVDGAPIIESSSGTMALGLALVGRALGHTVHIVTDPRIDSITLTKLRSLGATVHIVSAMTGHGWQSARLERLATLLDEFPGAFWPRQYENPQNPLAYQSLAAELLEDLGRIDILVGSVGSGGSLCGTAAALRRVGCPVRAVAVDAVGSVLFGQPDKPTRLQSGLGNSLVPGNLDHAQVNEVHWLNDREAFCGATELASEQALFAGNTAGSVYRVLRYIQARSEPGTRVVGILADRGDRYCDTVFDEKYWVAKHLSDLACADAPSRVAPGTVVSSWSYVVTETGSSLSSRADP